MNENNSIDCRQNYTVTDLITALICFALGYAFIKFVLFNPVSLYTMLFNFSFGALAAFYIKIKGKSIKPAHFALFGIAFLFNCIYAISSNPFISFIGGTFAAMLGVYILFISVNRLTAFGNNFLIDFARAVFAVPFIGFAECFKVTAKYIKKTKSSKKIGHILLGLLIGAPITVVCTVLLVSADDFFRALVRNVIDSGFVEVMDFVLRFGFGIPLAAYLFGMLFANTERENPPSSDKLSPTHFVPVSIVCSAVAPVCLIYGIFFISHFSYLTSALTGSLHIGFSHAQYARQGFFELCAVSFINLGIIVFLNLFDKKEEGETARGVKFFTLFISFSTLLLIITALAKMFLYIGRYGLSPLRVYTSWFMILLFVCFIIIAVRVFVEKLKLFKAVFAVFAVMTGLLCFGDVDGIIANYNISAYKSGKLENLDVRLLYTLSDTAVKYAVPLADDENVGEEVRRYLEFKRDELAELEFKRYNLESLQAKNKLYEYFNKIVKYH